MQRFGATNNHQLASSGKECPSTMLVGPYSQVVPFIFDWPPCEKCIVTVATGDSVEDIVD